MSKKGFLKITAYIFIVSLLVFLIYIGAAHPEGILLIENDYPDAASTPRKKGDIWVAPDTTELQNRSDADLIRYGRELIVHTALYLGPEGKVSRISNGLNCQNCHLEAGTKPFGNNYGAVASRYPMVMPRSGSRVTVAERINGCFERSLNGERLPEDSRELKAMEAYLLWVGSAVQSPEEFKGFGLVDIEYLDRPADPEKGKEVFEKYCMSCHGEKGRGLKDLNGVEWIYPPLFGENSYNTGAGLYRISKLARFVKANMPFGVSFEDPILTDEEAWDVAAYVNSMPRPEKHFPNDWPDLATKPVDYPFGPYADNFTETRHKYGPFKDMMK